MRHGRSGQVRAGQGRSGKVREGQGRSGKVGRDAGLDEHTKRICWQKKKEGMIKELFVVGKKNFSGWRSDESFSVNYHIGL